MITWITGNSGSGKTTLAKRLKKNEVILDGDDMRAVWPGLGFSQEDRIEQNMRVARLAKNLESQGFDVIVSTICPYKELRSQVQEITNCRFVYLEGGKTGDDYPFEI
jgi:adenylylsulfate kinase-like enzyme